MLEPEEAFARKSCQVASEYDSRAFNELKMQYATRTTQLEEATRGIDRLRRICKGMEQKLGKYSTVRGENQKLNDKVKRLQKKLEAACVENRTYLRELNAVKIVLGNTMRTDRNVAKIVELERSLKDKEAEYRESLDKIRNDARKSLLTLESRIVKKIKSEHTQEGALTEEIKKKLADKESVIDALNISNIRLKEKLELKETQYRELENAYLQLKVNSQRPKDICSKTDSVYKTILGDNIHDVLKEIANLKKNCCKQRNSTNDFLLLCDDDQKHCRDIIKDIFVVNHSEKERTNLDLTDDSCGNTDELLSIENVPRSFKIDIEENEISVAVKRCDSKDSYVGLVKPTLDDSTTVNSTLNSNRLII